MSLSSRAQTYLATLKRGSPVPVERVVAALRNAGNPVFDHWLDFHSRFAGYEETIGVEIAIWGIVHANPQWLISDEASVAVQGGVWRVACADVHPSYDYWLDSNGQFVSIGGGGPYESFDKKVERDAMFWAATVGDRLWEIDLEMMRVPGIIDLLCNSIPEIEIDFEASDKYGTCWKSENVIAVDRKPNVTVWVRRDARDCVLRAIDSPIRDEEARKGE